MRLRVDFDEDAGVPQLTDHRVEVAHSKTPGNLSYCQSVSVMNKVHHARAEGSRIR
jgi:hypothetical protein